ncbi:hypothetical protein ES703_104612 [subsurface metagenome]
MEKNKNKIIEEQPFLIKLKNYIKNLFDFSKYKKITILYVVIFIGLIGISIFLLYYNYFIDNVEPEEYTKICNQKDLLSKKLKKFNYILNSDKSRSFFARSINLP